MKKAYFKTNFIPVAIMTLSSLAIAGCKWSNQKKTMSYENSRVNNPVKDENNDESRKQETYKDEPRKQEPYNDEPKEKQPIVLKNDVTPTKVTVIPGTVTVNGVAHEMKPGENIHIPDQVVESNVRYGKMNMPGNPEWILSSSSQAIFSDIYPTYMSPVIYIKDGSEELLIAEKDKKQTLYGFNGKKELSSPLPEIIFSILNKDLVYQEIKVINDYSEDQPAFCKNIKVSKIGTNTIALSINKEHEKLTSLTSCSFKLENKTKTLPPHKFIFNFSYTYQDWKAHPAAVDINETIKFLEKKGINENTTELNFDNFKKEMVIKDITPILGLVNLQSLTLRNNSLKTISGLSLLTNLEKLYVTNNNLATVPDISNLKKLEILDLGYNKLTSVPGLSNLTKLKILHLNHNHLTEVPDLPKTNNLQIFYINNNMIQSIPHEKYSWIKNHIKIILLNDNPGSSHNFGN